MTATQNKYTIVEQETVTADYDMPCKIAILDTAEHGRVMLQQGFGGIDTLSGGAVRWRHGGAWQLQPNDTLQSLRAGEYNEIISTYEAMLKGYDNARPLLDWSGNIINKISESIGI